MIKYIVLLSLVACAGSFGPPRATPSARCESIESKRQTWCAVAKGAAVLAGGQGISILPVDNEPAQVGLAIGTLVATVAAVTAAYVCDEKGVQYTTECK